MSRTFYANLARGVAIYAVYCALWLGLDWLSNEYAGAVGSSPWYLGASLSFYLVYTFGPRYIPALALVDVLRPLVFGLYPPFTYGIDLLFGVEQAVFYGASAWLLRDRWRVQIFADLRSLMLYLIAGAALPALLAGITGVLLFFWIGLVPAQTFWYSTLIYAMGDAIGFVTLVPALSVFVTPLVNPGFAVPADANELQMRAPERAIVCAALILAVTLGYRYLAAGIGSPVYYLLFVPLIWLAARGGLRFAALGIVLADLSVVALDQWFRLSITASLNYQSYIASSALSALLVGTLVSQRWRDERQQLARARLDAATGLPNPQALEDWLQEARFIADPNLTLILVHVDNLRWVKEGLTRSGLDRLLASIALRLADAHVPVLLTASAGEGEFAIVLAGSDETQALFAAEKIRRVFRAPIRVEDSEYFAMLSFGIARRDDAALDPRTLLLNAEHALDEAHQRGMESIAFHTGAERSGLMTLSNQLHQALERHEFDLLYQPIFEFRSDPANGDPLMSAHVTGAEALLRWNHPQRGMLSPDAFIELLESMSLAERVGSFVIAKACNQTRRWHASGHRISIWINAFARQLLNADFAATLRAGLLGADLAPEHVVIELLERLLSRDHERLVDTIARVRATGARVAIDDFGTGHSSLARLREIPFDVLKIDRTFIAGVESDPKSEEVVAMLGTLARELRVKAVAEGIETLGQLRFVLRHCQNVQGFFLALPMPAAEFGSLLRRVNGHESSLQ